ncbi:hypothetical protein WJX73_006388 [Symbiochloris irregularis]|uniref:Uncharacterized protein n=1 Tax=Symbiochloris irregularis TaxID=706552 RepID=A0AAW1NN56_9CHLO
MVQGRKALRRVLLISLLCLQTVTSQPAPAPEASVPAITLTTLPATALTVLPAKALNQSLALSLNESLSLGLTSSLPNATTPGPPPVCAPLTNASSTADVNACVRELPPEQQAAFQIAEYSSVANQDFWYGDAYASIFANAPAAPVPPVSPPGGSAAIESGPPIILGKTISNGYQVTLNRQGVNDQRFFSAAHFFQQYPPLRRARYQALTSAINPAPTQFINPNCTGNSLVQQLSCAPRADALPSWADFSTLLASRWQGGAAGRFTHFIVWNEADNYAWFDMSPEVNDTNQHIENTPQASILVGRYVAMLQGTHNAIARNLRGQPTMMYVSTDRMWTSSPWCPGPKWAGVRCPLGTGNLLAGIWKMLNNSIDWSVVVHPYGDPATSNWQLVAPYQAYTFADLPKGWSTSNVNTSAVAAKNICLAHAIATNASNNVIWVAHNDFQDIYNPSPSSYGLIPLASGSYLNSTSWPNIPPTQQAYQATNSANWGQDPCNFCCRTYSYSVYQPVKWLCWLCFGSRSGSGAKQLCQLQQQ